MSWLIGPILASIVASVLIVKIWDTLSGGVSGSFLGVVRGVLFVGAWVAIITVAGMRGVNNTVRRINGSAVIRRLRTLTSGERS